MPDDWELNYDLPKEKVFFVDVLLLWGMFFDSVAQRDGAGVGVVLVSPEKHILPDSFILVDLRSNNVAEYQALILGLQMAIGMRIKNLDINDDSQLVIISS